MYCRDLEGKGHRLLLGECRMSTALLKERGPYVFHCVLQARLPYSLHDCSFAFRPLLLCVPNFASAILIGQSHCCCPEFCCCVMLVHLSETATAQNVEGLWLSVNLNPSCCPPIEWGIAATCEFCFHHVRDWGNCLQLNSKLLSQN